MIIVTNDTPNRAVYQWRGFYYDGLLSPMSSPFRSPPKLLTLLQFLYKRQMRHRRTGTSQDSFIVA